MKGPLFSFYGAKWRAAKLYDPPLAHIVEPFAGSACYASRYPDRAVTLVERDPVIAALWRWLIRVSPEEVRALPDLSVDSVRDEIPVCAEARTLIGFVMSHGSNAPRRRFVKRHRDLARPPRFYAPEMWRRRREQVAQGVAEIKHWTIIEGDWTDAPIMREATYFIDPPYQAAGVHYRYNAIDYATLGEYCRALVDVGAHVIVCEARGADWLPFRELGAVRASPRAGKQTLSHEVVWP